MRRSVSRLSAAAIGLASAILLSVPLSVPAPADAQRAWTSHLVGPRARMDLRSADASVRLAAARRLGRRGEHRRAVAALLEAVAEEEDPGVRAASFEALARRGDPSIVPTLAAHLADWNREDRAAALAAIGAAGSEAAVRVLVEWLGAADVGDEAVEALVRVGAVAVPHLLRALEAPATAIRAATALGRIGDARATAALVAQLERGVPAARVALVEAIGRIGDERASSAVVGLLEDPSSVVVQQALSTLARIAGPEVSAAVAELADRGPAEQRSAALSALMAIDPEAGLPRARQTFTEEGVPPVLQRAALESVLAHPTAAGVELLTTLAADPSVGAAAAEALARVPGGGGLPALLELARADAERRFDGALALGVRRHEDGAPSDLVESAREHVRGGPGSRSAVLAALARDDAAVPALRAAIASSDPVERAVGAHGLTLLGARASEARAEVSEQLMREEDPAAFRALAAAALSLGARVDPARIDAHWWDPATAPEALWSTAANLDSAAFRTRRRARRAMRRALRSPRPRVRAGAALALALTAERSAWRALVATLEDEHDAVRLAAARALASLGVEEAVEAVAARRRVEPNPSVRALLAQAQQAGRARPVPPLGRGPEALYVRVVTAPGVARGGGFAVDLLLPDGRWLRIPSLETGEVILTDLPGRRAEVHVLLSE